MTKQRKATPERKEYLFNDPEFRGLLRVGFLNVGLGVVIVWIAVTLLMVW